MKRSLYRLALVAFLGTLATISTGPTLRAAIESRDTLKTYFETGDVPTQEQFADMIDSYISLSEDRGLLGLQNIPGGFGERLGVGDVVDASSLFGPAEGLGPEWISQSSFLGLSFEQDSHVHYGYLHLITDIDGAGTMYPVTIDRFVFENVPGAGITISPVPEPGTVALAAMALVSLAAWGWRRKRLAQA